jgi:hypothetical protein
MLTVTNYVMFALIGVAGWLLGLEEVNSTMYHAGVVRPGRAARVQVRAMVPGPEHVEHLAASATK